MPELDRRGVLAGDITTAAAFCKRIGVTAKTVYNWRTRGYVNEAGEVVKVQPIPGRDDGLGRPVYWAADLEEAEYCTRYRARTRGSAVLAADQERHRAARTAHAA